MIKQHFFQANTAMTYFGIKHLTITRVGRILENETRMWPPMAKFSSDISKHSKAEKICIKKMLRAHVKSSETNKR